MLTLPDTRQTLFTKFVSYGFEHGLEIYRFRPSRSCPIVEVKEPSGYCTGINCVLILGTRNLFGLFGDISCKAQVSELDDVKRSSEQSARGGVVESTDCTSAEG